MEDKKLYAVSEYFLDNYSIHECEITKETKTQYIVTIMPINKDFFPHDGVAIDKSDMTALGYKFVFNYEQALRLKKEFINRYQYEVKKTIKEKQNELISLQNLELFVNSELLSLIK